jgi:hypothetical protein
VDNHQPHYGHSHHHGHHRRQHRWSACKTLAKHQPGVSPQWEVAINEELQSLASNNVWKLVNTPKSANVVTNKWVFKVKRLPDGRIDRYKARLVARGFSQQYGVDYDETFAPAIRMETLRHPLAIAAAEG